MPPRQIMRNGQALRRTVVLPKPVMSSNGWHTNADMIAEVARLYIPQDAIVLDPTYGRGVWWKKFLPDVLLAHDLFELDGVNFTSLPEADNSVDVVAFDPPYVSMGGRSTSTIHDLTHRYGMHSAPRTPQDLRALIKDGMAEAQRVLRYHHHIKKRGRLLVKAQDYVSSGKLQPGTAWVIQDALDLGFTYIDRFEYVAKNMRPQPKRKRQVHSRRNVSSLLVFRR